MDNYIVINNQRIDLTEEQIERIVVARNAAAVNLSAIPVGETFRIGKYEFIVLEQTGETTAVILKELYCEETKFADGGNNYDGSYVDAKCQEFAQELSEIVSWDNIVLHSVDLTSDDGLKDYGAVQRRASLPTADQYRRYVVILDKHKLDNWWWLATPHSTATHENANWIRCVSPSGYISNYHFNYDNGVRPFCILKSNIFVSK